MVNFAVRPLVDKPHGPLRKDRTKVVSRALIGDDKSVVGRLGLSTAARLNFRNNLSNIRLDPYKHYDKVGALNLRGMLQYLNFRTTR